jgi:Lrp/AsnC family leucine-responsive transcriptional regulator
VRRLEADGTIQGYRAVLDKRKLGLGLTVFTEVKVSEHSPERAAGFEEAIAGIDEITGCWIISGRSDFLLQIAVPDVEAYEPFYVNTILALPGVYDVETHFVLRTMKEPGPLPVRG